MQKLSHCRQSGSDCSDGAGGWDEKGTDIFTGRDEDKGTP
jgi:hypothetical protein